MTRRWMLCSFAAVLGAVLAMPLFTNGAEAQQAPVPAAAAKLDGAALFQTRTCFACHGVDAKTPLLPEYPILAGQNPVYLLNQMRDIKSGARNNGNTAAMAGVMHLVNDAEMEAIASWLAVQPR